MKILNPYLLMVGLLYVCTFQITLAHGDLHGRILDLTVKIDVHPDSTQLYLERGELRLQHETFSSALRDFETCIEQGLESDRLHTGLAKCHLNLDETDKALHFVNLILSKDRNNVKALRLKGYILSAMHQYEDAATHFDLVIQYADQVFTENYMESSIAWEKTETEHGINQAESVLLNGIDQLGHLFVFHKRLVELHQANGNYEMALKHQTLIIESSNRKEHPYYQRGLLHLEAGNFTAAKADFELANRAIKLLPERLRSTTASQNLQEDISLVYQQLE